MYSVVCCWQLRRILCAQALLDEERSMSAKNQQLKVEVEKLAGQVKAAEEGE